MPRQHGPAPEPLQPAQRLQIVGETAVFVVDDGGAAAQNGVGGEHRVADEERQRVRGVSGVASTVMRSPAASITSPSVSGPPSPRRNPLPTARTVAPVASTILSMPSVWSPCL